MSIYVMSDLHGAFDALQRMLKKIHFSSEDELYIIGDVVDRGPDGVKILQYIMETPNIHMLLGNHEFMCMQFFKPDAPQQAIRRWNRNGNFPTLSGLDQVSSEEKAKILNFIESLPSQLQVKVGDTTYILVHGFLGENAEERVWNRPKIDDIPELLADQQIIIGHTPVCEYVCPDSSEEDLYVYSRKLTENGDHFRIFHARGFIDIDCCAGYGLSAARLACLRLDDGKEFYEKVEL